MGMSNDHGGRNRRRRDLGAGRNGAVRQQEEALKRLGIMRLRRARAAALPIMRKR